MNWLIYTGASLVAIFVLVLVHELGHFLVAKLFCVKVKRFSIGLGKPFYIWKSKKGATEYVLSPLPIGGYVKLLDSREAKIPRGYLRFAFDRKPIWQRLTIIAAGPIANLIFAFFAFWLMFIIGFQLPKPIIDEIAPKSIASFAGMHGDEEIIKVDKRFTDNWGEVIIAMLNRIGDEGSLSITTKRDEEAKIRVYQLDLKHWEIDSYNPDPLLEFGLVRYKPKVPPVVFEVVKDSPAKAYGIQKGDHIIEVAGTKVANWDDFIQQVKLHPSENINILLKRAGKKINLPITTGWKYEKGWKKVGFLGVGLDESEIVWPKNTLREYKYTPSAAISPVLKQIKLFFDLNDIILGKLLIGKISLRILGGPIATFTASGQALAQGFVIFMGFLAMLSLTIAMINLLPLPGLDGGYLIIILIEAIRGRPISMRVQMLIFRLGIALLVLLILQTTANDLARMFGS